MNGEPRNISEEPVTAVESLWHYTHNGNRLGPVPESQLIKLLETEKIDQDAQVWKPGMNEWIPIRQSAVAVKAGPPPIAADLIRNGFVWLVAFVPLIDAAINLGIREYILEECQTDRLLRCHAFMADHSIYDTPWWVVAIVNSILCILDERRLAKAGYSKSYMPFLALFIVPVYLFARASRLRQTAWYGLTWVGCLLVSLAFLVD